MKRLAMVVCFVLVFLWAGMGQANQEGVLYYDRGHHWLEISVWLEDPESSLPPVRSQFEIVDVKGGGVFNPSRVEVLELGDHRAVFMLSSGKIKGKNCYRLRYNPGGFESVTIDSICDPFHSLIPAQECSAKRFFRKKVAPAFSRSGEIYSINTLTCEYDATAEKSSTNFNLEPVLSLSGLNITPSLEYRSTSYSDRISGNFPAVERSEGIELSKFAWVGELRYGLSGRYNHQHTVIGGDDSGEKIYGHQLSVQGWVRLDNLFDPVNRYCLSVLKGVDLGFGYAWYSSNDEEVWGTEKFNWVTPFFKTRFTWTILYGIQISYMLESFWPESVSERFEEYHSIDLRLLLRDILPARERRPYHPDLLLTYRSGRKLPLFEKEEKISLGFTFDLFPW